MLFCASGNEKSKGAVMLKKICGVLVLLRVLFFGSLIPPLVKPFSHVLLLQTGSLWEQHGVS